LLQDHVEAGALEHGGNALRDSGIRSGTADEQRLHV
jgi:hypothetical protein